MNKNLMTEDEKKTYTKFVDESKQSINRYRWLVSIMSTVVFVAISSGIIELWMSPTVEHHTSLLIGGGLFSLYGALLLAVGVISKPEILALISMTYTGGNIRLFRQLMKVRLTAQVGIYFIVGGFLMQAVVMLVLGI